MMRCLVACFIAGLDGAGVHCVYARLFAGLIRLFCLCDFV